MHRVSVMWLCVMWLGVALMMPLLFAFPAKAQESTPTPSSRKGLLTAAGCNELIDNGSFEVSGPAWEPLVPGLPPELNHHYVDTPVFAGAQALKLGIPDGANTAVTNGVVQRVSLPRSANPIVLSFHYLPQHGPDPGDDLQFLDLVDAGSGERITRLWAQLTDRDHWLFLQFDLTSLRGRTVRMEFGVKNDGEGGDTALYIDVISLLACDVGPLPTSTPAPAKPTPHPTATSTPTQTPSPTNFVLIPTATSTNTTAAPAADTPVPVVDTSTPTSTSTLAVIDAESPSPTPTPFFTTPTATPDFVAYTPIAPSSPTPLPEGCTVNVITNGSFEYSLHDPSNWIIGNDPVPPELSGNGSDGLRSLRLGHPPNAPGDNVVTYSSVRQLISLPVSAVTAKLFWDHESFTQAAPVPHPGPYEDRQELILLTPELVTKRILYRTLLDTQVWLEDQVDLTPFIGQTFYIYFNVYNNGDGLRTWMHLDDVRLELCTSVPTPTPFPAVSQIVADTPTPSPSHEDASPRTGDPIPAETAEAEVSLEVDEVELVLATDSELELDTVNGEGEEAVEEVEQEARTMIQRLGQFLNSHWQWAIPWALLGFLLFWRFLR